MSCLSPLTARPTPRERHDIIFRHCITQRHPKTSETLQHIQNTSRNTLRNTSRNIELKIALAAGMFILDLLASDFSKFDLNRSTVLLNLVVETSGSRLGKTWHHLSMHGSKRYLKLGHRVVEKTCCSTLPWIQNLTSRVHQKNWCKVYILMNTFDQAFFEHVGLKMETLMKSWKPSTPA